MVKDAISSTPDSEKACKGFEAQVELMASARAAIQAISGTMQYSGQEQVAAAGPGQQRGGPSEGIA